MRQPLPAGVELFNAGKYFEAHEAFEDVWRQSRGGRRLLLQGLVQICAGLLKERRRQSAPARSLLEKGLLRIESTPAEELPEIDLADLVPAVRSALLAVASGRPVDPPVMRLVDRL